MHLPEIDRITSLLTDYLDIQSRRAELVASNLANADTPNFRAQELDFQDHLRTAAQNALVPQANRATPPALDQAPRVVEQTNNVPGIDGNSVDVGREMATLADAGGQFVFGTQLLQAHFRTLRLAIREGR
jgi:flagellar basal-body rod protein FlgB